MNPSRTFSLKIFSMMLIIFTAKTSVAEVFRWPKLCLNQTLTIENKSNTAQDVWLQEWETNVIDESHHQIPANTKIYLQLSHDPNENTQDFSLLALDNPKKLLIETHCDFRQLTTANSLEGGVVYYKIDPRIQTDVELKNLFPGRNTFFIEELSVLKKNTPLEIEVPDHELFKFTLKPDKTSVWLKITAKERFRSSLATDTYTISPSYVEPQSSKIATDEKYFLVGPSDNNGDQFIVKIKDSVLVQKARDQINNPNLQKIVFAKIQLGSQGYNRNLIKKEKSFWSWSVSEVTNISDFGSTVCNGFPQMVEDQAKNWVNGVGKICFWSYRIKKELSADEIMNPSTQSFP